jgi:hypothetical protein
LHQFADSIIAHSTTMDACCAAGAPVSIDYMPQGSLQELGGVPCYATGDSDVALVGIYDIFGFSSQVGAPRHSSSEANDRLASTYQYTGTAAACSYCCCSPQHTLAVDPSVQEKTAVGSLAVCTQFKQVCDKLAAAGYLVVGPDVFRGKPWSMGKFPPKPEDNFMGWLQGFSWGVSLTPLLPARMPHKQQRKA